MLIQVGEVVSDHLIRRAILVFDRIEWDSGQLFDWILESEHDALGLLILWWDNSGDRNLLRGTGDYFLLQACLWAHHSTHTVHQSAKIWHFWCSLGALTTGRWWTKHSLHLFHHSADIRTLSICATQKFAKIGHTALTTHRLHQILESWWQSWHASRHLGRSLLSSDFLFDHVKYLSRLSNYNKRVRFCYSV